MIHNQKTVKLYNIIFPFWMMRMMPWLLVVVLPANFLIDSLVLILSMYALKVEGKLRFYGRHIFKVFFFGMLADILSASFLYNVLRVLMELIVPEIGFFDELYVTIPGVIIAGALIYIFDYFVTFKDCEKQMRRKLSLIFAIATAPYTMLLRNSWF